jgi:hypothetical protein
MASQTKYAIGDRLSVTDLNGKIYRLLINTIAEYEVAHQLGVVEILAMQYPPPNDTVNKETTLFYICSNVPGDSVEFHNTILWDQIIDHSKTVYLTQKMTYRLDILPTPPVSGQPVREGTAIIANIKKVLSDNIQDAAISYTDITNEADNELERLRKAVDYATARLEEYKNLESIRPLIAELLSIDFQNLTTGTMNLIADIQQRLAVLDAGGANLTQFETQ